MPLPLFPRTNEVLRGVRASKQLEKLGEIYADDGEVIEKIATIKAQVDNEIFGLVKEAAGFFARHAPTLGKSLLWGTGLALPGTAAGAYLLHRGTEEGKELSADIRNKVLQGALGLTGLGAGLYGLHRLVGGRPLDVNKAVQGLLPKQASVEQLDEEEYTKLATVGAIEVLLDDLETKGDTETKKLAAEVRILNRCYGIQLLHELCE